MKIGIAGIMRKTLMLAVMSVPLTLLFLSACGGGGGAAASSGGSTVVGAHLMGGAIQGVTLNLASASGAASATVSTLAGLSPLNTAADGVGQAARFKGAQDSIVDGAGDLFVLDTGNNIIRKIVIATGAVTTVAGQAGVAGAADGTGLAATFNGSNGITTDGASLYVSDFNNNKIRKITPASGTLANMTSANAVVTSFTGTANTAMTAGAADTVLASATFNGPYGLTIDSTHANLYVADSSNNKIRKIVLATGQVSSLTGPASAVVAAGAADSASAVSVTFNLPVHLAIDSTGTNLYVADALNHKIRQMVLATGATSSLTGAANTAGLPGAADGAIAANVTFNTPIGMTIDSTNANLYVADSFNQKIRQIALTGTPGATSSFTGSANAPMWANFLDGAAVSAMFSYPQGIITDGTNLYVADINNNAIRQIAIAVGQVTTLAGGPGASIDGTGAAARFDWQSLGATDGTNLYVAECGITHSDVRKIEIATGKVTTLAGNTAWTSVDGTGLAATFNCPAGITTDGSALYVADSGSHKIRKIAPSSGTLAAMTSANAVVTTLAGTGTQGVSFDGTGLAAAISWPWGITTDGINLYITEGLHKLRKIAPASGSLSAMTSANAVVTTLAGTGMMGAADGTGTAASFFSPGGITTDGKVLFVADSGNNKIRRIAPASGTLANMTSANAVVTSLIGAASTAGAPGAADGPASAATFIWPGDITTDGTNLYVDDSGNNKIRMISPTAGATLSTMTSATATVSSITGASGVASAAGYADGAAAAASFNNWSDGIVTDGISLYVQDTASGTVRKIK